MELFSGNGSSPAQNSTRSISPNNSTTNSQFSLQHNSSGSLTGGIGNGNGIAGVGGGVGGSGGSGLGSPNCVGGGGSCTPTSLQPQVSSIDGLQLDSNFNISFFSLCLAVLANDIQAVTHFTERQRITIGCQHAWRYTHAWHAQFQSKGNPPS